jgi:two-component system vancomycin resistance associated response regulator VraR
MRPARSILVVDDNAAVSAVIRNYIETTTDHKVCAEARDGVEAIEKATELHCDLIVLDLMMPLLNGVEAAAVLRRMVPETKIVGLTMFGGEFTRAVHATKDFDLVLSKTEGLAKLGEAVSALLASAA